MILLQLSVLALAVARLSYMLVEEEGPYQMFVLLRQSAGVYHDEYNEVQVRFNNAHQHTLGGIVSCIYCASVWIGAFFALGYLLLPLTTFYFALPFALSALTIFVRKLF